MGRVAEVGKIQKKEKIALRSKPDLTATAGD
jgi:hypothetical protein